MSAFSYTIMCNFAHNQLFLRMKKPLKRITIAGVSVLLLLLVAGSFFMTTYALKANSNRVEQQEDTWRIMSERYPDLKMVVRQRSTTSCFERHHHRNAL